MRQIIIVLILLQYTLISFAQIPEGYYSNANDLTGEQLKSALHNIIKNHKEFPYTSIQPILGTS